MTFNMLWQYGVVSHFWQQQIEIEGWKHKHPVLVNFINTFAEFQICFRLKLFSDKWWWAALNLNTHLDSTAGWLLTAACQIIYTSVNHIKEQSSQMGQITTSLEAEIKWNIFIKIAVSLHFLIQLIIKRSFTYQLSSSKNTVHLKTQNTSVLYLYGLYVCSLHNSNNKGGKWT